MKRGAANVCIRYGTHSIYRNSGEFVHIVGPKQIILRITISFIFMYIRGNVQQSGRNLFICITAVPDIY